MPSSISSTFRNRNNASSIDPRSSSTSTLLLPQLNSRSQSMYSSFSFFSCFALVATYFLLNYLSWLSNEDGPTMLLRVQKYNPSITDKYYNGNIATASSMRVSLVSPSIQISAANLDKRFINKESDIKEFISIVDRHKSQQSEILNKRVVVFSHEFSITGAPRVCAELAQELGNLGADVSLSTLSSLVLKSRLKRIDIRIVANLLPALVPQYFSFSINQGGLDGSLSKDIQEADVVIISTAVVQASTFVSSFSQTESRKKLVWWIHESESVMNALGEEAITCALEALSILGKQQLDRRRDEEKMSIDDNIENKDKSDLRKSKGDDDIENNRMRQDEAYKAIGNQKGVYKVFDVVNNQQRAITSVVIFPSLAAQSYWITIASQLPETMKANAVTAVKDAAIILWGLPSWKLSSLRFNGRKDVATQERAKLRLQLGINENDIVFLSLGTLHALKGHAGIVRAMQCAQADFNNARNSGIDKEMLDSTPPRLILVAVGGGFCADRHHFPFSDCKSRETLDILSLSTSIPCSDLKKNGDSDEEIKDMSWIIRDTNFHFLPAVRRIEPYFAMADVLVSNTLGGGETWGLAILEAMGAGLPVLAAARGGSVELIVDGESGLLHNDEIELVKNIKAISNNAELRIRLGIEANKRASEMFGEEHVIESVKKVVFG
jgi:glycosyltransferase involved in cell wall biosynthesis